LNWSICSAVSKESCFFVLISGGIWKKESIAPKLASIYPVLASKRGIQASKSPKLESKSESPLNLKGTPSQIPSHSKEKA
jgi:hypothetical protein